MPKEIKHLNLIYKSMTFQSFVKNAQKDFARKFSEHRRLLKQIEGFYASIFNRLDLKQKARIEDLHKEAEEAIKLSSTNIAREMNIKFEEDKSKLELEYMKKEVTMLQFMKDSLDGKEALIQSKLK